MYWVLMFTVMVYAVVCWYADRTRRRFEFDKARLDREREALAAELKQRQEADATLARVRAVCANQAKMAMIAQEANADWLAKRLARIEGEDVGVVKQRVKETMAGPHMKVVYPGQCGFRLVKTIGVGGERQN